MVAQLLLGLLLSGLALLTGLARSAPESFAFHLVRELASPTPGPLDASVEIQFCDAFDQWSMSSRGRDGLDDIFFHGAHYAVRMLPTAADGRTAPIGFVSAPMEQPLSCMLSSGASRVTLPLSPLEPLITSAFSDPTQVLLSPDQILFSDGVSRKGEHFSSLASPVIVSATINDMTVSGILTADVTDGSFLLKPLSFNTLALEMKLPNVYRAVRHMAPVDRRGDGRLSALFLGEPIASPGYLYLVQVDDFSMNPAAPATFRQLGRLPSDIVVGQLLVGDFDGDGDASDAVVISGLGTGTMPQAVFFLSSSNFVATQIWLSDIYAGPDRAHAEMVPKAAQVRLMSRTHDHLAVAFGTGVWLIPGPLKHVPYPRMALSVGAFALLPPRVSPDPEGVWVSIAFGDFDGDGRPDMALAHSTTGRTVQVYSLKASAAEPGACLCGRAGRCTHPAGDLAPPVCECLFENMDTEHRVAPCEFCREGFFQLPDGNCAPCHASCRNCKAAGPDACTSCPAGMMLGEGRCDTPLPAEGPVTVVFPPPERPFYQAGAALNVGSSFLTGIRTVSAHSVHAIRTRVAELTAAMEYSISPHADIEALLLEDGTGQPLFVSLSESASGGALVWHSSRLTSMAVARYWRQGQAWDMAVAGQGGLLCLRESEDGLSCTRAASKAVGLDRHSGQLSIDADRPSFHLPMEMLQRGAAPVGRHLRASAWLEADNAAGTDRWVAVSSVGPDDAACQVDWVPQALMDSPLGAMGFQPLIPGPIPCGHLFPLPAGPDGGRSPMLLVPMAPAAGDPVLLLLRSRPAGGSSGPAFSAEPPLALLRPSDFRWPAGTPAAPLVVQPIQQGIRHDRVQVALFDGHWLYVATLRLAPGSDQVRLEVEPAVPLRASGFLPPDGLPTPATSLSLISVQLGPDPESDTALVLFDKHLGSLTAFRRASPKNGCACGRLGTCTVPGAWSAEAICAPLDPGCPNTPPRPTTLTVDKLCACQPGYLSPIGEPPCSTCGSDDTCAACPVDNCAACMASRCITCHEGFLLTPSGECAAGCPDADAPVSNGMCELAQAEDEWIASHVSIPAAGWEDFRVRGISRTRLAPVIGGTHPWAIATVHHSVMGYFQQAGRTPGDVVTLVPVSRFLPSGQPGKPGRVNLRDLHSELLPSCPAEAMTSPPAGARIAGGPGPALDLVHSSMDIGASATNSPFSLLSSEVTLIRSLASMHATARKPWLVDLNEVPPPALEEVPGGSPASEGFAIELSSYLEQATILAQVTANIQGRPSVGHQKVLSPSMAPLEVRSVLDVMIMAPELASLEHFTFDQPLACLSLGLPIEAADISFPALESRHPEIAMLSTPGPGSPPPAARSLRVILPIGALGYSGDDTGGTHIMLTLPEDRPRVNFQPMGSFSDSLVVNLPSVQSAFPESPAAWGPGLLFVSSKTLTGQGMLPLGDEVHQALSVRRYSHHTPELVLVWADGAHSSIVIYTNECIAGHMVTFEQLKTTPLPVAAGSPPARWGPRENRTGRPDFGGCAIQVVEHQPLPPTTVVQSGDFNADGLVDLLAHDRASGRVVVYLSVPSRDQAIPFRRLVLAAGGHGTGAVSSSATGSDLFLADVNNDGMVDLVMVDRAPAGGMAGLTVLSRRGNMASWCPVGTHFDEVTLECFCTGASQRLNRATDQCECVQHARPVDPTASPLGDCACPNGMESNGTMCVCQVGLLPVATEPLGWPSVEPSCAACGPACETCSSSRPGACASCRGGLLYQAGECVVACTGAFRLSKDGTRCVSCPAGCDTCVGFEPDQCATCLGDNQYLARGLGDPRVGECRPCHPGCSGCTGPSADECLACAGGWLRVGLDDSGPCVAGCPAGTGLNASQSRCLPCADPNCATCMSDAPGAVCLACAPGSTLAAPGTSCIKCHSNCGSCHGPSSTECLTCRDNYFQYGVYCLPACPPQFIAVDKRASGGGQVCERCPNLCSTCSGSAASPKCDACVNGADRTAEGRCELAPCPGGGTACPTCPVDGCERCNGDLCIQCAAGRKLLARSNECTPLGQGCPDGTYLSVDEASCQECFLSCKTCSSIGVSACLSCDGTKVLVAGVCLDACPTVGFFAGTNDDGVAECHACDESCGTCTGPGPGDCVSCAAGHAWFQGRCMASCPAGMVALFGQCIACDGTCAGCAGAWDSQCTGCSAAREGAPPTGGLWLGQCLPTCPEATFSRVEAEGALCARCMDRCMECTGPGVVHCQRCFGDLLLHPVDGCVATCGEGFFPVAGMLPGTGACLPCLAECRTCSGTQDDCTSCPAGRKLTSSLPGRCVDSCPAGEFVETDPLLSAEFCVACHATCAECHIGAGADQCTACPEADGTFLHQGACVSSCPGGFFKDDRGHGVECSACMSDCDACTGPSAAECEACVDGRLLLHGVGTCLPIEQADCPAGWFLEDPQAKRCVACAGDCAVCTGSQPAACTGCMDDRLLLLGEGTCLPAEETTCPAGWFASNSTARQCGPCAEGCHTCHGLGASDCVTCAGGRLQLEGEGTCLPAGQVDCPAGWFLASSDEGVCGACAEGCDVCTGSAVSECQSCASGHLQLEGAGTCLPAGITDCPSGWYRHAERSNMCGPCAEGCDTCTGPTAGACQVCADNRLQLRGEGTCLPAGVTACPAGWFLDGSTGNTHCGSCSADCASCTGSTPGECLSCLDDRLLLAGQGTCLPAGEAACPAGWLVDLLDAKRCNACAEGCAKCRGPGASECDSCAEGRLQLEGEGTCLPPGSLACPSGWFFDESPSAERCRPCSAGCAACTGTTPAECGACLDDRLLLTGEGTCLPAEETECPMGWHTDPAARACLPCPAGCASCPGSPEQCVSCEAGKLLLVGPGSASCVATCPGGWYAVVAAGKCAQCNASCPSCTGPNDQGCSGPPDCSDSGGCAARSNLPLILGLAIGIPLLLIVVAIVVFVVLKNRAAQRKVRNSIGSFEMNVPADMIIA
ncbi:hypothetical protein H696_03801 [Fonticula alba]|uniref:EGF-like domain-containing protein n=1 Tax=Fonticula alba TaxID=691883 RepID=A0A058Z608_FONAL|nr:hypothetical protein H696_03801 [Fonticula alba]KCV69368.1 hypothetical protein H696_03801 [Fonticula alba]|eukprot:XP_009495933.1 hypothetical protein H696_03801 [Fonticula alba]